MMFGMLGLLGMSSYLWGAETMEMTRAARLITNDCCTLQTLQRRATRKGGRKARSARRRLKRVAYLLAWRKVNNLRLKKGWRFAADLHHETQWSVSALVPLPWYIYVMLFGHYPSSGGRWALTIPSDLIEQSRKHKRFPLAGIVSLARREIHLVDKDDGKPHDIIYVPQRRGYLRERAAA